VLEAERCWLSWLMLSGPMPSVCPETHTKAAAFTRWLVIARKNPLPKQGAVGLVREEWF